MLCIAFYCTSITVGSVLHTVTEDWKNVVGKTGIVSVLENEKGCITCSTGSKLEVYISVVWLPTLWSAR
jgi:hypothetical protein